MATEALEAYPADVEMRLLRARALLALRRDDDAQADLRDCLRRESSCAIAYRLLGEMCFRRDDFYSASVFLTEAVRLRPADVDTRDLLAVVDSLIQPTAVVEKLPAATAAVGCTLSNAGPRRARNRPPRLAVGTHGSPDDLAAPTVVDQWPVPTRALDHDYTATEAMDSVTRAEPFPRDAHPALIVGDSTGFDATLGSQTVPQVEPRTVEERRRRSPRRHHTRRPITTQPPTARYPCLDTNGTSDDETAAHKLAAGFGHYLLSLGAVDREQLGRARLLQKRSNMSLGEAVVCLGYSSEPTIETAALAYRAAR